MNFGEIILEFLFKIIIFYFLFIILKFFYKYNNNLSLNKKIIFIVCISILVFLLFFVSNIIEIEIKTNDEDHILNSIYKIIFGVLLIIFTFITDYLLGKTLAGFFINTIGSIIPELDANNIIQILTFIFYFILFSIISSIIDIAKSH